jgi:hypothetical protein
MLMLKMKEELLHFIILLPKDTMHLLYGEDTLQFHEIICFRLVKLGADINIIDRRGYSSRDLSHGFFQKELDGKEMYEWIF